MPSAVESGTSGCRPRDPEDYADVDRAITTWAEDFAAGSRLPSHRHKRAQLVYGATGVMTVTTPAGSWVVPPLRAVWVPAGTDHAIRMSGAVAMRTLYIRPDASSHLPVACSVLAVSPLLRELILRAMELPILYEERGPPGRLMALILDEIRTLPVLPLDLPMPGDKRLDRICQAILRDPRNDRGLEEWAPDAGASARTLARLFQREMGMSFGAWRQQARLLEAIARIAAGTPITTVALDLGYDSSSAFTYMFRRALGVPPSRYFAGADGAEVSQPGKPSTELGDGATARNRRPA